jgi:hypothetical protein
MAPELSKAIPVGALKEDATVVNPVALFVDALGAVAPVVELAISPFPYKYKIHKAKQAKVMVYKEIFFIMSILSRYSYFLGKIRNK